MLGRRSVRQGDGARSRERGLGGGDQVRVGVDAHELRRLTQRLVAGLQVPRQGWIGSHSVCDSTIRPSRAIMRT